MTYFLPSFFQKRILRYALSRLELLDTDALDLEKLDIAWGRRSTVELRDVGLRLTKLSSLLHLPSHFILSKASIRLLRITVPADLYYSSIVVELEGVDGLICVNHVAEEDSQGFKGKTGRKGGLAKGVKSNRPRSTQPLVHDPGGVRRASSHFSRNVGDEALDHLPTTVDLAKSFLQSESDKEKAELQANIAKSQNLKQSEVIEDDEAGDNTGVGMGFSLPGFLADFLGGVGDRLEVRVKDVQINIEFKVDSSSPTLSSSPKSARFEVVTFRLWIEEILINGIGRQKADDPHSTSQRPRSRGLEDSTEMLQYRQITIKNAQGMVVSDASLFSIFSQLSGPPSPVVTHSNALKKNAPQRNTKQSFHKSASSSFSANLDMSQSTIFNPRVLKTDSGLESSIGTLTTGGEKFAGARPEDETEYAEYSCGDSEKEPGLKESPYLDSGEDIDDPSSIFDTYIIEEKSKIHDTLPTIPYHSHPNRQHHGVVSQSGRQPVPSLASSVVATSKPNSLSLSSDVLNFSTPEAGVISPTRHNAATAEGRKDAFYEPASSLPRDIDYFDETNLSEVSYIQRASKSPSPHREDLAQSKIFSHEEAESMYMSAMSDLPGAWNDSEHGKEEHSYEAPANLSRSESLSTQSAISHEDLSVERSTTSHSPTRSVQESQEMLVSHRFNDNQNKSTHKEAECPNVPEDQPFLSQNEATSQRSTLSSPRLESSSRVVKRFLSIDFIVLQVPIEHHASSPGESSSKNPDLIKIDRTSEREMPGTFSTDSMRRSSATLAHSNFKTDFSHQNKTQLSSVPGHDDGLQRLSITVSIGEISLLSDMGLVRLLVAALQQQLPAISSSNAITSKPADDVISSSKLIVVDLKKFSWLFLDVLRGEMDSIHSQPPNKINEPLELLDADILLSTTISDLHVSSDTNSSSSVTNLSVRLFRFGYATDYIVSFNSDIKMRESTRDILLPVDHDIAIKIIRSIDMLQVNVTTLPLHVVFDLARLDETFGWFGGLSSVLGLGSSMMSTVTVVEPRNKPVRNANRTRGVRFETPKVKNDPYNSRHCKVTTRIGGLLLELQGRHSSLLLESTAMKLVSRTEGMGLQVDKCKFSGPHILQTSGKAAMSIHMDNIRIEYLPNPKEVDLARLLALLSPSRDKYEPDDDILLETLLRQRRQGGVVRATIAAVEGSIPNMEDFDQFSILSLELSKLSTVAKYLPEDDRPGILTLALIRELEISVYLNDNFRAARVACQNTEVAHVAFPSLILLGIRSLQVQRHPGEELCGEALTYRNEGVEERSPMVMARLIGDELEPTIKVKLWNLRVEYHVATVMAMLGLVESTSGEILLTDMISSVATLTGQQLPPKLSSQTSSNSDKSSSGPKILRYDVAIRESMIGLNPRNSPSRGLVVLSTTNIAGVVPNSDEAEISSVLEIKKASLMVIDNISNISHEKSASVPIKSAIPHTQVQSLTEMGYVSISDISSAKVTLNVVSSGKEGERTMDVEVRDDLFVIESCADSTQTLIGILNGLNPPMPPNRELKYRTEVVPVQDMLASFSGDAFATDAAAGADSNDYAIENEETDMVDDDVPQNLEFVSSFYNPNPSYAAEALANSILEDDLQSIAIAPATRKIGDKRLLESFQEQYEVAPGSEPLDFREDHFGTSSTIGGTAHRWNSDRNTYDFSSEVNVRGSPFRIRVRDVHIIWNLFDGFDWQHTRDTISQAVAEVESKAMERMARRNRRKSVESEDEEDSVIGDFLFNSIYIGIPANRDPRDLARQVNRNIDDLASETGSYATSTTATSSPSRQNTAPRTKKKKLRLARSKHHKMTFELKGVSMDMVVFPPGSGETQSSIDVRVQDLEIFDHVPTSTWKKFATYMHDAGERESGTSMVHVEILNVKPVPDLAASEIILKATILPLRLHVDQDALDFMTRFFEFKDDSAPIHTSKSEIPFLQRVEVNSIPVKLDFKPKRVDYAGLRSGHTTEFMNFFILDQADMVLRHVIIYGVSGFDKLGKTLNDIWMPDIKRNQLPGILAGLAPVRSLVNVGGGVKDLVVVPMREYRKDGRVMRSISKGAISFAKTTTTELTKLGAKLAIGAQTVLQSTEDYLTAQSNPPQLLDNWEPANLDDEERKTISLYADQPVGVIQGLRGAYKSLERDLLTAKDAIIAMPGEVMESGSAGGAAKAVMRGAPTVILRPALGVSKAVGQTLLGATNSLDKGERRRVEDKYKRH